MEKLNLFKKEKGMVFAVIFLLIGVSFLSSVNRNVVADDPDNGKIFPSDDAFVSEAENQNYGDAKEVQVANKNKYGLNPNQERNIFIKFDVASDHPDKNTVIDSATLYLYYYEYKGEENPAYEPLTVYRVRDDWNENTITYNTQPRVEEEASSSSKIPELDLDGEWMSWDVTNDVQDFIARPENNNGWKIMDETKWDEFNVPVICFRSKEYSNSKYRPYLEINIIANKPPGKPDAPLGALEGKLNFEYLYTTNGTHDPERHGIYYLFDWGDGTYSKWKGEYKSGEPCMMTHCWESRGEYKIKVKACDDPNGDGNLSDGLESEWSDSLPISMPKNNGYLVLNKTNDPPDWYVSKDGSNTNNGKSPEEAWETISYAVAFDNISNGDVIHVLEGHYTDEIYISQHSITLEGEDKENTTIEAANVNQSIITITHGGTAKDKITITNFTIKNKENIKLSSNIDVKTSNVIINNCILENNEYGIYVGDNSCNSLVISDCDIYDVDTAIYISHVYNVNIINCNINGDSKGITCYSGEEQSDPLNTNITISNCNISTGYNSGYNHGIKFTYFKNCRVRGCSVNNAGKGIYIINSEEIKIYDNCNISENDDSGIIISGSSNNNYITECTIENNYPYGIKIARGDGFKFPSLNRIWNNVIDSEDPDNSAYDECPDNFWHRNEVGNYWNWHEGDDFFHGSKQDKPDPDGIIDHPYDDINGKEVFPSKDLFPIKYDPRIPDPLPPRISIIYPNGGEYLYGNATIRWIANDSSPNWESYKDHNHVYTNERNIRINISCTAVATNETRNIATNLSNTDSFNWDTTGYDDGDYLIEMIARDNSSNEGSDISQDFFIINNDGRPYVSKIVITDTTIDSSNYVKNGHDVAIMANIIGDGVTNLTISANLTGFGKTSKVYPDGYNNVTATWFISNVVCSPGNDSIKITVTAENKSGKGKNSGSIIADNRCPNVTIYEPEAGIWLFNRRIIPFLDLLKWHGVIAIGEITIKVKADDTSGINDIKWYCDGNNSIVDANGEDKWTWDSRTTNIGFPRHTIKVVVYDNAGNYAMDDMKVWKFF